MSEPRYAVGIDLGTSHSAIAYSELGADRARPKALAIPQLVSRASIEPRPLLPSCLYLPHESEGPQALPWDDARGFVVGAYARARGAEAPGRYVASAKSWLSHPTIDRRAGILPIAAAEGVEKISPVEASWRYLEHLAEAFESELGVPLAEQDVLITVPASFDASARELTVEAATAAGLDRLTLLEEPQAALYAWIDAMGDRWREALHVGDVLLVVDIGGGTTDFSAIEVREANGSLELHRVAVGDHILLGGDNMDLALSHGAAQKWKAEGKEIDRAELHALSFAVRDAKERLLGDESVTSAPVTVASRGSQLVGRTLRADLTRDEITSVLVDGFLPVVAADARPVTRARVGLTQIGLPYASDPAITKHLASFLSRQAGAVEATRGHSNTSADRRAALLHPTAILFNGGVMKGGPLRNRLVEVVSSWLEADGAPAPRVLDAEDLDLACARGAAYYGLSRTGLGVRIRGGTARSYYVGIEGAVPAVPGVEPPIVAFCVAPFGMEEGSRAELPPHEVGVVVGEPVRFRFFGSSVRRDDHAGAELESWREGELEELAPIEITLPAEGRREGDVVPVKLASGVTDVGTLLLEAVPIAPRKADERWRIELSVRSG